MKNTTLASILLAAVAATPAMAAEITPEAQAIIEQAVVNGTSIEDAIASAIAANPDMAESLLAAGLEAVGPGEAGENLLSAVISALPADSGAIPGIMSAAIEAGIDADTVTGVAIASGVDASIASLATAAGPNDNGNNGNNANANGLGASSGNANGNAGAGNNNAGGGGGGGGVSGGQ